MHTFSQGGGGVKREKTLSSLNNFGRPARLPLSMAIL